MLREFLNRRGQDSEAELINAFSSRLTLSKTRDQVETQVRDLLASLPQLSLDDKKSGTLGSSSAGESGNTTDGGANSVVPAIGTSSPFQPNKDKGAFSLRSAWWASNVDSVCNCHLETCRACRSKGLFSSTSVPPSTSVSSSFEPLME